MSLLVVDKPSGPTSFAVLKRVKRALIKGGMDRRTRIGHGGTLDPMASGVLPVCIGEGTKVLPFLLDADKEYEAILRLGVVTDTLDAMGKILSQTPVLDVDEEKIRNILAEFVGPITQVPPMYSALKKAGRPLYQYARAGQEIPRPGRKVTVFHLELLAFGAPNLVSFRVRCSKGTYVRTLAADVGERLGVGGHLVSLRRIASGPFHEEQALDPAAIEARVEAGQPLPFLTVLEAVAHLPRFALDEAQARALFLGQTKGFAESLQAPLPAGPVCAVTGSPLQLVAIVEQNSQGEVKIRRGFHPSPSA